MSLALLVHGIFFTADIFLTIEDKKPITNFVKHLNINYAYYFKLLISYITILKHWLALRKRLYLIANMYTELKISLLILKTYVDKNKILRKSPNYFKWHCNLFYHIVLDALSKQLLVINILSAIGINYFFGMSLPLK